MKYASVLLAVGCLATAVAQQWQVELVDSSCRPAEVFVRRDSARTYVAYITAQGCIRIASKDTAWSYEDVDTGMVRPILDPYNEFHFSVGPANLMTVSGVDDSLRPVVVERSDSVWGRLWTHERLVYVSPLARAVCGADSVPAVVFCDGDEYGISADVIVETRVDSVWQVDTAAHFYPGSQFVELTLYDADGSREAGPCFLIQYAHGLPKSAGSPWTFEVYKGFRSGEGWRLVWLSGGFDTYAVGYDIIAGGDDTASAASCSAGYTKFDRDSVWAGRVIDAAVQADSAGPNQLAFVTSDGVLMFAYKDTRWHYREVPGVTTARCCDLALDEYGQPLIAFEDGNGLWLAHGVDMLGVDECPALRAPSRKQEPTVLSGSSVPSLKSNIVFDAMGRRIRNPKSGVFFVREPSAVIKVLITR